MNVFERYTVAVVIPEHPDGGPPFEMPTADFLCITSIPVALRLLCHECKAPVARNGSGSQIKVSELTAAVREHEAGHHMPGVLLVTPADPQREASG